MTLKDSLDYTPVELKFGTSGLRGIVTDMTDLECYINTIAFLDFLEENDDLKSGDPVFIAGDLRDSTPRILASVVKAIQEHGNISVNYGLIPTPTLALYALEHSAPCIMVTGSHIPADRNGIKFYKRTGEVLKGDEAAIVQKVVDRRQAIYNQDFESSGFTTKGVLQTRPKIPSPKGEAESFFKDRYLHLFNQPLTGKHIVVYQHSAVGRDLLVELCEKLGARVTSVGRSDAFVPIDTENVTPENKAYFKSLAQNYPDTFAIVSTDGDSDRPFVIDEHGVFYRGDVLGCLVAEIVQAKFAAIPISSNDAADDFCAAHGITLDHTKIGSPFVISAMEAAAKDYKTVVGWEVNGGFLSGSEVPFGNGKLAPLPTRDAFLPILAVLIHAASEGKRISELFRSLPRRFTGGGLLDLTDKSIEPIRTLNAARPEVKEMITQIFIKTSIGAPQDINTVDGIRMTFAANDVIHIRPSGNAPQLRVYTNSDSQERADQLAIEATKPNGLLEQFAQAIVAAS